MQFDKKTYLSVNEVSGTGSNVNNNAEIQGGVGGAVEPRWPIAREKTDPIILAANFSSMVKDGELHEEIDTTIVAWMSTSPDDSRFRGFSSVGICFRIKLNINTRSVKDPSLFNA